MGPGAGKKGEQDERVPVLFGTFATQFFCLLPF